MKKLSWGTFIVLVILQISCEQHDVIVKLSLYETDYYHRHYIKAKVSNNTDRDIFIPYCGDCISVYYDDIDITDLIKQRECDSESFPEILSQLKPDTLALMGHKDVEGLIESEFKSFLVYNNLDTKVIPEGELSRLKDELIDPFCTIKYYSAIFIKAGEVIERYIPIHNLYCEDSDKLKNDFVIKFARHSAYVGLICDTIAVDGYKLLTGYSNNIVGYDCYTGSIKCDDVINLNSGKW